MGVQSRDIADRFGANLARIRERGNLSQEEVGFSAKLHRTKVGMLECGVRLDEGGRPDRRPLEAATGSWLPGQPAERLRGLPVRRKAPSQRRQAGVLH
jgi:transcriptional regulator with XRE-family HTH domain